MTISQIKATIQDNITPILFGGLILFIILSIVSEVRTNKYQVTDLLNYVETSTPYIISQTTAIANGSIISSNTPEAYDKNISQLNDLKNYLVERNKNIPKHPTEIKIDNFIKLYTNFMNHIIDRVDSVIRQQETIRELNTALQSLPATVTTLQQGNLDEIKSLSANARTIYDTLEKIKSDAPTYSYITTAYFSSYSSLMILAQDIAPSLDILDQITDEFRTQSLTKINNKPPLNSVLFPAVGRYQIEDDAYINYIKQLQDRIKEIKTSYSL